ncbi:MAG: hypothetical protein EXR58_00375 [Chloroflexi bacterium]|nr:hypothetical protein [Chloroflexota bacterium]
MEAWRAINMFHMEDATLQEECSPIYNDNLIEYCSVAPDHIYGICLLSAYDIDGHGRKAAQGVLG